MPRLKFFIANSVVMSPWDEIQDITIFGEGVLEGSEVFEPLEIGCKKNTMYLRLLDGGERGVDVFVSIYDKAYEIAKEWTDREKGLELPLHHYPLFYDVELLSTTTAGEMEMSEDEAFLNEGKFFWLDEGENT